MDAEKPIFDSVQAALRFALNADQVTMPRPFMNKAMAEVKVKPKKVKKRRAGEELMNSDLVSAEELLAREQERGEQRRSSDRPRMPTGLDAAATAGFILATLARLDLEHQAVLTGLLARPTDTCPCQRPCCRGWLFNPRHSHAVKQICHIIKETGDVTRTPGKKGLSTPPAMREAIVRDYFLGGKATVMDFASTGGVTLKTAAAHRAWIVQWLELTEAAAILEADAIFDSAGIVGATS